ncbi:hypothetical protein ACFP8W_02590 [Nocardioides hankookensis]
MTSTAETVTDGLIRFSMDAAITPRKLPAAAPPTTSAVRTSTLQPPIGFSRSWNAMNMIRKPDIHRGPQLARSA